MITCILEKQLSQVEARLGTTRTFFVSAWCMHAKHTSVVFNSVTPWTVAHQASLSMGFSRQEYWSGLPCPPPGDLPDPRIEAMSLTSPAT